MNNLGIIITILVIGTPIAVIGVALLLSLLRRKK